MTHYTHINRVEHKQSSELQHHTRSTAQCLSAASVSVLFVLFFTLHFPFCLHFSVSVSLQHAQCMHARRGNRTPWYFLEMKWKLAPIKETSKVTSVHACHVVEGIQLENTVYSCVHEGYHPDCITQASTGTYTTDFAWLKMKLVAFLCAIISHVT